MEETLVIIKPDGFKSGILRKVVKIYQKNGLEVLQIKIMFLNKKAVESLYEEHKEKFFFKELASFMLSGPVVAIRIKGQNAIERVRIINGSTVPEEARVGTIRWLFGRGWPDNAVHASASKQEARREIEMIFKQ